MQEDYNSSHTGQQIDNAVDNVITANSNGGIQSKNIVDVGGYFSTDTVEGALQALGAAKLNPTNKTSAMTQAVGKDSNGTLWTEPSGGGGSGEQLLELSPSDGVENLNILNTALIAGDVKLKSGEYPLYPGVVVDGVTLDLNNSVLTSTETKYDGSLLIVKGKSPCIKNGTLSGNFTVGYGDTGYEFFEKEGGVSLPIGDFENVIVENVTINNVIGYGIRSDMKPLVKASSLTGDIDETKQYYLDAYNPDSSTETLPIQHTNNFDIPSQFIGRYITARHGHGYNSYISDKEIVYSFYDENESVIKEFYGTPGEPIKIPNDAVRLSITVTLSEFKSYRVFFYKYTNTAIIDNCIFHNNGSLGIANLPGNSTITNCISYENGKPRGSAAETNNSTTGFIDVEDIQTPYLYISNCKSFRERNGIMSRAFHLTVVDCNPMDVSVYNGWDAYCSNIVGYGVGETVNSHAKVVAINCTYINRSIATFSDKNENFVGYNCTFVNGFPRYPEQFPNFKVIIDDNGNDYINSTDEPFTGSLFNEHGSRFYTGLAQWNKFAPVDGTKLTMEMGGREDKSTINGIDGDCYGVEFVNCGIVPNGHKMVGCTLMSGELVTSANGSSLSGNFEDCTFNIDSSAYWEITHAQTVNVMYKNCTIHNSVNPLYTSVTGNFTLNITFINCTIDDIDNIYGGSGANNVHVVYQNTQEVPVPSVSENNKVLTVYNGVASWESLPVYDGGVD